MFIISLSFTDIAQNFEVIVTVDLVMRNPTMILRKTWM
jgi:hypothetical protein